MTEIVILAEEARSFTAEEFDRLAAEPLRLPQGSGCWCLPLHKSFWCRNRARWVDPIPVLPHDPKKEAKE